MRALADDGDKKAAKIGIQERVYRLEQIIQFLHRSVLKDNPFDYTGVCEKYL